MLLASILKKHYPGCAYYLRGDTYAGLEWEDTNTPKPTEEHINALIATGRVGIEAEHLWFYVRKKRNTLLAESDWSILPDSQFTDTKKQEWRVYRQALRDITTDFTTPDAVVWPTPPG